MTLDAASTVAIGDRDGMVVLELHEAKKYIALDPQTAKQVGEHMTRCAYKVEYGKFPEQPGSMVRKEIRDKLATRVALIIRNLQSRGKDNKFVAQEVVDTVLSEVK